MASGGQPGGGRSPESGDGGQSTERGDEAGSTNSDSEKGSTAHDHEQKSTDSGSQAAPYRTIVESVGDGVYVVSEDMTLSYVNDQLCAILGRSREELLGTDPRELLVGDGEPELAASMREEVLAGERTTGTVAATAQRPDGERVELEARYTLLSEPEDGAFPGTAGVIRDVTERNRRERNLAEQRALLEGILNTIPDVVFAFDETGRPLAPEFLQPNFAGYSQSELATMSPLELVPADEREAFADLVARVLETGEVVSRESTLLTADGERVPYEFRATRLEHADGDVRGIVGSGRDISERVARERTVERRRDELATLNRITGLLLDIVRDLVEARDRRTVEQTICEQLATSDLYRFAWIGERAAAADGLVGRVSAGCEPGEVADGAVTEPFEDGDPDTTDARGAVEQALESGRVQVAAVGDATGDGPAREDQADNDRTRDGSESPDAGVSVAAVPLCHGETVYGVLRVDATRTDAFSEREQAGFRVLGETMGFVVNAVKRRKLLFADAATELAFDVGDTDAVLGRLAADVDCELSLDGYVEVDGRWLAYLDVAGRATADVADALGGDAAVASARVVADEHERRRIEVALTDAGLLAAAATAGATVASARATPEAASAVLEVPSGVDVRETVELVTASVPGATLRAQRERNRRPDRADGPGSPLDRLTERQRDALAVAYRAGYYEWPRESPAEAVADSLGVSRPTLHGHLRKAERAVFSALLDGD